MDGESSNLTANHGPPIPALPLPSMFEEAGKGPFVQESKGYMSWVEIA